MKKEYPGGEEERAKRVAEIYGEMQNESDEIDPNECPCPRCGHPRMKKNLIENSLSRYANVYICPECGMDEALRDFTKVPVKLTEWFIYISMVKQLG